MKKDITNYFLILLAGAVLGYSLGHTLLVTLCVAIGLIVWQSHRVNLLNKWLDNPKDNPVPEMGGLYYLLHKKLNNRNIQYAKRKKQLSGLLSQFRQAVGAMPDAIVLINVAGKIEWANINAIELLGIRWPDDAGVRFTDLIRHPEVEVILNDPANLKETKEINSIRLKQQDINFKSVPYSKDTRMLIARDVSRLIKVNRMHSDFVANVSHELKTPLTVLRGYVEILQSSDLLPDQFAKPLDQMNIQSLRMQFIVSDLLYLAKLEDKANRAPSQAINMTHLINTIIESVQPMLEEKRHKIALDLDHDLTIMGSETELHSALSNLITNAINYTEPKGEIKIKWASSEFGATFSIKDNGLGIPSHHLGRLTQRFYRVDTDRSRDGGGTGLGLAIVKHVLQRHDAELEIESVEGAGSTFLCHFSTQQLNASQQQSQA